MLRSAGSCECISRKTYQAIAPESIDITLTAERGKDILTVNPVRQSYHQGTRYVDKEPADRFGCFHNKPSLNSIKKFWYGADVRTTLSMLEMIALSVGFGS